MTTTDTLQGLPGLRLGRFPADARPQGDSRSLVNRAMDAVTGHIRDQGLRVGDTLPGEAHFATSLGVSRAVMREAFGALAALQVIDVGNGRKPRVGALDGSVMGASLDHAVHTAQITVPDVWDVRRTIEVRTAALAAERRTDAEAARILELAEAMAHSQDDFARLTQADIAFHAAIAEAGHNPLFVQIVSSFANLMEVAVPAAWETRKAQIERESVIDRHLEIARAIHDRDAAAAMAAMDFHFDSSIGDVLRGMSGTRG